MATTEKKVQEQRVARTCAWGDVLAGVVGLGASMLVPLFVLAPVIFYAVVCAKVRVAAATGR